MKPLSLNMSKFQKIKGDENHSVFKHDDGHTITISHKALSPQMRGEVVKIPTVTRSGQVKEKPIAGEKKGPRFFDDGGEAEAPAEPSNKDKFLAKNQAIQDKRAQANKELMASSNAMSGGAYQNTGVGQGYVNPNAGIPVATPMTTRSFASGGDTSDPGFEKYKADRAAWEAANPGRDYSTRDSGDPVPASTPAPPVSDAIDNGTANVARQMSIPSANAKGGAIADPTQRGLLPGDAIPNAIEKQVVAKGKKAEKSQKMADGGDAGATLPTSDDAEETAAENEMDQPEFTPEQQRARDLGDAIIPEGGLPKLPESPNANLYDVNTVGGTSTPITPFTGGLANPGGAPSATDTSGNSAVPSADFSGSNSQAAPPVSSPQLPDTSGQAMSALAEGKRGANQFAQAEAAKGQEEAGALQKGISQQDELQGKFSRISQDRDNEYNTFIQAARDQKIDPNHYLNSMSTGQKIGSAIGLIIGGIGSSLRGTSNPAVDFINKQIDRDIEGQRMEMGQKMNLLSANQAHYRDQIAATDATKAIMSGMTADKLRLAAANATGPEAKARALQTASQYDMQAAQLNQQVKMRQFLMQAAQSSQMSSTPGDNQQYIQALRMMGQNDMAKDLEGRTVPGVGTASIPVPDKSKGEIAAKQNLYNQLQALRSWSQQNGGTLDPAKINYGRALAGAVSDLYRQANLQGVRRESEANFLNGIMDPDPSKFLGFLRTDPGYKAIQDSTLASLNQQKQTYGLRPGVMPVQRKMK